DGGLSSRQPATIREAVRGDVDDPHDPWTVERKSGDARARLAQRLQSLSRDGAMPAPVTLAVFADFEHPGAAPITSHALDHFQPHEREPATGKLQAGGFNLLVARWAQGGEADGSDVEIAGHRSLNREVVKP